MRDIVVNGYVVNWQRAELSKDGQSKALEAKQLALLKSLAQAEGNIVSQEQLLDDVWTGTVVTANTVQQTIAQLRKILDDDGKSQRAIKTHPKLGYSLVFTVYQSTNINKDYQFYRRIGLLVFLLASVVFAAKYMLYGSVTTKVEVNPVTVEGENVQQFTYHQDSNTVYFVEQHSDTQRLVSLDNKQQKQVLVKDVKTTGGFSVSPNGELLALATVSIRAENKKCIQVSILELSSLQFRRLGTCSSEFNHSPQWIDNDRLIYQSTSVTRQSQLRLFDLSSNKVKLLESQTQDVEQFAVSNNQVLTMEQGRLLLYQVIGSKLKYQKQLMVDQTPHHFVWLNDNEFAVQHGKSISIYNQNSLLNSFDVPGLASIKHILMANKNKYLAVLQQLNWDVRERRLSSKQDLTVGQTQYVERQAKYRNGSSGISYLSKRTGRFQVWIDHNEGRRQLTFSPNNVTSHIWFNNGQLLLFVANGRLWKQSLGGKATSLNIEGEVGQLFDGAESDVLLSVKQAGLNQLVSFNIDTGEQSLVYLGEVSWAQKLNDQVYISNDEHGKLAIIEQGKMKLIPSLADIKLQWRYFYKPDQQGNRALYFQDKQKNIWRYHFAGNKLNLVGQFDENALFMTDFSAINMTMLSDNFIAEKNELVEINLSR